MPVLLKGGQSTPSNSADGRAGCTKRPARPARPSAKLNQSSSADGRARSTTRPARPSAELDRTRDQLGHPPRWTSPVRRMAELDRTRDQLGRPPSWTSPVRWMAELDRTRDQLGHLPRSREEEHLERQARPIGSKAETPTSGTPSSSADGRAGSTTRPARPSAELDQKRDQLAHPPSWTSPVRRMAELDRKHDQLGGWSSWIEHATSSAIHQAGPVQFVGWPSWIDNTTSSAIRRAEPVQLGRWPSWIEHATSLAIRRGGLVQFGGWPSWIEQATSSAICHPAAKKNTWNDKHGLEAAKPKRLLLGTDEIRLTAKEQEMVLTPYHDALVISLTVANCLVKKILEDNGSSGYIIFHAAYKDLGLEESALTRRITPLIGFSGETTLKGKTE
ncbi:hypothetical protein DY000_02007290 [Brassica cretica]|uniref:Uncharacterized protein n=1 Tax=Brassica cretica TaxID=69181 RepID=A0ABQ7BWE6_BRACR|nr:hypothetical protein DY000_02007290 [Brassica cretica]